MYHFISCAYFNEVSATARVHAALQYPAVTFTLASCMHGTCTRTVARVAWRSGSEVFPASSIVVRRGWSALVVVDWKVVLSCRGVP
jgi:hypothetical protein